MKGGGELVNKLKGEIIKIKTKKKETKLPGGPRFSALGPQNRGPNRSPQF